MSFTDSNKPVPSELRTDEFKLRPITVDDAALDYEAVMDTRVSLRLWEQSTWPEDHFTVGDNRQDLAEMESRHNAGRAFSYTVLSLDDSECLGCVYVFPHDATFLAKSTVVAVGDDDWTATDAVVYFWVRSSGMESGMDARLLEALRAWFRDEWQMSNVVFVVSKQFEHQVELLRATDMAVRFELTEPEKSGSFEVFG
ncbi:GNAT family N-acetyltransferase [Agrococcus casei]|uniref:N-acetyltransferase domain-containing protein n=1 Tax=Agrococcus casei LMG 22410 TaxID=1255656 RepID=A0A1R4EZH1_9MICO|nr:hypothetical protein [Agrococcus casei]SJM49031.1 hypothetical protein CZ674_01775 [Agrococcus casei LMG 22410]